MKPSAEKIKIGISSCLIGQEVRYNGGHKFNAFINHQLGQYMEFLPYCPEVAIGLGVPRAPIRIVKDQGEMRIIGTQDASLDVTRKLQQYGRKIGSSANQLCGYIFKAGSPSCGMERVKTYNTKGLPLKSDGVGAFAQEIMQQQPNMPVEEEGRLNDPGLRENFIECVFTYYRWKKLRSTRLSASKLIDFHSRHKLTVMAHNQAAYRRLGQMLSDAGKRNLTQLANQYESELMAAMHKQATRKSHTNVLQHLQGYFSRSLSATDRTEITQLVEDYHAGLVPLIAPLTLIRHHFLHHPNEWALSQTYLEPYPAGLKKAVA